MIDWMEKSNGALSNYERWKNSGKKVEGGKKIFLLTKTAVATEVAVYLGSLRNKEANPLFKQRGWKMVKDKLNNMEKAWKAADLWLQGTGNGLLDTTASRETNPKSKSVMGKLISPEK